MDALLRGSSCLRLASPISHSQVMTIQCMSVCKQRRSVTPISALGVHARPSCTLGVPVMAADGHAYEPTAIERWLASKSTSPLTGGELEHSILVPNHMLRRMIRDWQGAQKD